MFSRHGDKDGNQDAKFLGRLKEDLRVLEASWQSKSLRTKKVLRHFLEIVDAVAEIARTESLESAENICDDMKEYLASVTDGQAKLGERAWLTASKLIDLISDSLLNGSAACAGLEQLQVSWKQEVDRDASATEQEPPEAPDGRMTPSWETFGEANMPEVEESTMAESTDISPQELLQKAQQALSSGDGEGAKDLALKAAQLIAKAESEQRHKREATLKADFEAAAGEESEAEQSTNVTKEKIAQCEEELNILTERLSQAQSALDEREDACKEIRKQIDDTEVEMASIKEKHKQLLDQFQEVLPARDAATRECERIKSEYGKLPEEIESLRDNLQDLEHRLEQIRAKKAETEAELAKLSEEIAV